MSTYSNRINLDQAETYQRYDPDGMRTHLHNLPQQIRQAWDKANELHLPHEFQDINKIVICGMGGSAIGGDLLRSLTSGLNKPLVFVNREYDLPSWADDKTLVVISSYSGNTEETLSAFQQALKTDCKKVAFTTNGKVKQLARDNGIPTFTIDYISAPRAALGYSFIPLITLLSQLGFLSDKSREVQEMAQILESSLTDLTENVPESANPAKQLAQKLAGKIIVIYGAGTLSPVARRWKGQFNENSKAWAFYETLSELNHNSVVGYEFPHEMSPDIYVILLRCPLLHPRIQSRYTITSQMLSNAGVEHQIVNSKGNDDLSQMMSLVFLGDWTSYYLAMLYEADPTPVKAIDFLKEKLKNGGGSGI